MAVEEAERRRRLNDNRVQLFGADRGRTIVFICECEDVACRQTVLMTAVEYEERIRRGEPVVHHAHVPTA